MPPFTRLLHALTALAALTPGLAAHAARPMITDDARIVDAKSCQIESWVRRNRGNTEQWALPGCNFTGNLELTIGGARTRENGDTQASDVVIQGKTLFRTLEPNGWSIGLAAGHVAHPDDPTRGRVGDLYAYVPASFSLRDDRLIVHTNVGALRDSVARRNFVTVGLGAEQQLTDRMWLVAEGFRQTDGAPFFQLGVRFWIVPNRVQVDTTYGDRFGARGSERWFSIGLRLLSPAFLP